MDFLKFMIKLFAQNCNNHKIALGIQGESRQEIEQKYYSLWNWGATSSELEWMSERFGFCWTDKIRLLLYFKNIEELNWDVERILTNPLQDLIDKNAIENLNKIKQENFLEQNKNGEIYYCGCENYG